MSVRTAPTLDEVRSKRYEILRVLEASRAHNPRVFGSVARGDAVPESDIDLVVEFDESVPSGWDYFGMVYEIQEALAALLGRPVHIVEITNPSKTAERIRKEAVPL
jgi:predicted nucleotidyltransferase